MVNSSCHLFLSGQCNNLHGHMVGYSEVTMIFLVLTDRFIKLTNGEYEMD